MSTTTRKDKVAAAAAAPSSSAPSSAAAAVDLPGIPPDVAPLLLNAIQSYRSYLSASLKLLVTASAPASSAANNGSGGGEGRGQGRLNNDDVETAEARVQRLLLHVAPPTIDPLSSNSSSSWAQMVERSNNDAVAAAAAASDRRRRRRRRRERRMKRRRLNDDNGDEDGHDDDDDDDDANGVVECDDDDNDDCDEEDALLESRRTATNAGRHLLDAVRKRCGGGGRRGAGGGGGGNAIVPTASSSVPVACLAFLFGLIVDDLNDGGGGGGGGANEDRRSTNNRDETTTRRRPRRKGRRNKKYRSVNVRRASLALSGELLRRSAECRSYAATSSSSSSSSSSSTVLLDLVSAVCDNPNDDDDDDGRSNDGAAASAAATSSTASSAKTTGMRLLRTEATDVLRHLSDGYGKSLYPRFDVAYRCLVERLRDEGLLSTSSSMDGGGGSGEGGVAAAGNAGVVRVMRGGGGGGGNHMDRLRRDRDDALTRGSEAIRRSTRVVDAACKCFDALMPRFGFDDVDDGGGDGDGRGDEKKASAANPVTEKAETGVAGIGREGGDGNKGDGGGEDQGGGMQGEVEGDKAVIDAKAAAWSDDEDDDDNIDWEEGDDVELGESAPLDNHDDDGRLSGENLPRRQSNDAASSSSATAHAAAVERTLAVMETTLGGVAVDGALEIDFDNDDEEVDPSRRNEGTTDRDQRRRSLETMRDRQVGSEGRGGAERPSTSPSMTTDAAMRRRLQQCVDSLSSRHLPRLTRFVDGLINADGMTEQHRPRNEEVEGEEPNVAAPAPEPLSLVLLPAELRKRRAPALRALMAAKGDAARVLASAAKLGVVPGGSGGADGGGTSTAPAVGGLERGDAAVVPVRSTAARSEGGGGSPAARNGQPRLPPPPSSFSAGSDVGALPRADTTSSGSRVVAIESWRKAIGVKVKKKPGNDGGVKSRLSDKEKRGRLAVIASERRKKTTRLQIKYRKS